MTTIRDEKGRLKGFDISFVEVTLETIHLAKNPRRERNDSFAPVAQTVEQLKKVLARDLMPEHVEGSSPSRGASFLDLALEQGQSRTLNHWIW